MNKMFKHQIRRNIQVYIDDMLVKSLRKNDHLDDLQETFNTLRSYNMKLNPSKCMFGVTTGKFLGFMVSQRGIEVNPEKVRATKNDERSVKPKWENCSPKQVHPQSDGQMGCHSSAL